MTVYVDVLLALNLFVNYFLLLSCGRILRCETKRTRLLLGAFVGAVYSLIIFAPDMNLLVSIVLKLAVSVIMTAAVFGFHGIKSFLRACGCLFGVSFVFGGLMLALWLFFAPDGMVYKNGAVYFDISLLFVAVATVICYIITAVLSKLLRRSAPENHLYKISITLRGKIIETTALMDTGNSLSDSFTDTPVILVERSLAEKIIPPEWMDFFNGSNADAPLPCDNIGYRLVPFRSVGGSGMLPAFQPDLLEIHTATRDIKITKVFAAVVGANLSAGDYSALLNPRLLGREERGNNHEIYK